MALPSENRLKSEKLISVVCRKGASWKTPFFRCVFLPSYSHIFQSVVVVSKKYDKRAVSRNQVRRKINGALQQEFSQYKKDGKSFPACMCVIFPYDSAREMNSENLHQEISQMIQKISHWDFSRKKSFSSNKTKKRY